MRKRLVLVFLLLVVAMAGVLWALDVSVLHPSPIVDVVRAKRGTLSVVIPLGGMFERSLLTLSFEESGYIAGVYVREGEHVRAGELLASLDGTALGAHLRGTQASLTSAEHELAYRSAGVEAARRNAEQAEGAYREAQANLAIQRSGPDRGDVAQAEAAAKEARLSRDEARRNYETQEDLYRQELVTRAERDAARTKYEIATAEYGQALAKLAKVNAGPQPETLAIATERVHQAKARLLAAQAEIAQARELRDMAHANLEKIRATLSEDRTRLARNSLQAPFEGIVVRQWGMTGGSVSPNQPVISLASLEGWVRMDVDEKDIGRVQVGQLAKVRADAYPNRSWTGRVVYIGQQVEEQQSRRTVPVRVTLKGDADLRVGTQVEAKLFVQEISDVLLVPIQAVNFSEDRQGYVLVVSGGVLQERGVRTGVSNGVEIQILDGIAPADIIVVSDASHLRAGLPVRVRWAH